MDFSSTVARNITEYLYGLLDEWNRHTQKAAALMDLQGLCSIPMFDADISKSLLIYWQNTKERALTLQD